MESLERGGAVKALTRLLAPLLRRLFPLSSRDGGIMAAISENVSANLLGLGNAATPAGIRAAQGISRLGEPAKDELCRLVVLNTASIQLIPSTIAAVRAANGAASAFDIMPAVWFSSVVSVAVGLVMAKRSRAYGDEHGARPDRAAHRHRRMCAGALQGRGHLRGDDRRREKKGARHGRHSPAPLVLFPVIYLLRASGLPELLERSLAPVFKALGIPVETSLLMPLRPVSGKARRSA